MKAPISAELRAILLGPKARIELSRQLHSFEGVQPDGSKVFTITDSFGRTMTIKKVSVIDD